MARPPKYSSEQILDAVVEVLRRRSPAEVTIAMVADVLGAPSGSIYHRFPSRDALLAAAWLRIGERFQGELAGALGGPDPATAAIAAVSLMLDWARRRPAEATFFLLHTRSAFTTTEWPPVLARRAVRLANDITDALARYAARVPGVSLARARFALMDVPQAAIRRSAIAGSALDDEIQHLVLETVGGLLAPTEPVTRMAS
ncbi:MAG: TetR/AcrR family transcriptional regulator [Actinomycetota bacterium]|nr:TetR/AcrR family transcriptional regulator [Actinomycetota bacterium]